MTTQEYNKLIKEISERVKDMINMKLEKTIKERTPKELLEDYVLDRQDGMEITYIFGLIVNDIKQMLGRIRRDK